VERGTSDADGLAEGREEDVGSISTSAVRPVWSTILVRDVLRAKHLMHSTIAPTQSSDMSGVPEDRDPPIW